MSLGADGDWGSVMKRSAGTPTGSHDLLHHWSLTNISKDALWDFNIFLRCANSAIEYLSPGSVIRRDLSERHLVFSRALKDKLPAIVG